MLSQAFLILTETLLAVLGYSGNAPEMVQFWVYGFALLATFFVACLPFIIVYKVVRWLGA